MATTASTSDPRKLLAASRKSRRITSPYASYSLAGALFCNICNNLPIKSESLWESHVTSQQHRANVARKGDISGGKSNKRPAESPVSSRSKGDGEGTASKRIKTANPDFKNLTLPVGFFDSDDDDEDEGVVSTGEVIEPDDEPKSATANSKLPSDFFSSTSKSTNPSNTTTITNNTTSSTDDLDDEWAAFQADIATTEQEAKQQPPIATPLQSHTISAPAISAAEIQAQNESLNPTDTSARNPRSAVEEEIEDARAAMADFFEEQSTLEERVQRLKQRREMLRRGGGGVVEDDDGGSTPTASGYGYGGNNERMQLGRSNSVPSVQMGGMDDGSAASSNTSMVDGDDGDDGDDEEDYDDDDDMFFRRR
ncbi:hypothetical protein ABW19_dt0202618 [Dactylella cylindrospora]|nr:hypothetical protein ABW19_dt0202618 [Dactylella cylindrospora]